MFTLIKKILQYVLAFLAKRVLGKYKPQIIAIGGSVGKTAAKDAIAHVLNQKYKVGKTMGNLNTELGVPASVLLADKSWDIESDSLAFSLKNKSFFNILKELLKISGFWVKTILHGCWLFVFSSVKYPEILVLELAEDKPGDMQYLLTIVNHFIGVITAIGEIPVHVKFYASPQQLAYENSLIISKLPIEGLAILNFDEKIVKDMANVTQANVIGYAINESADFRALNLRLRCKVYSDKKLEFGIRFQINYKTELEDFYLPNAIGQHQVYAILAAAAVGKSFDISLKKISEAVKDLKFAKHRMRIKKGKKNVIVLDDCYNSSPLAAQAALDSLKRCGNKLISQNIISRKVAVLGDMLELGKYSKKAHYDLGICAAKKVDILICIGKFSKYIVQAAKEVMSDDRVYYFKDVKQALKEIDRLINKNDFVLIKGSRAIGLEKMVNELI
jgi:UDP-N-acetylmuramoyl-tripeptide--D-alanyl-D-alanine ligase